LSWIRRIKHAKTPSWPWNLTMSCKVCIVSLLGGNLPCNASWGSERNRIFDVHLTIIKHPTFGRIEAESFDAKSDVMTDVS
jgi:hypothetical protein